jgi:alpha-glucosidase
MKNLILTILIAILFHAGAVAQKRYSLKSPDGKLLTEITVGKQIEYAVAHNGDQLLLNSPISMQLANGTQLGVDARVAGVKQKSVTDEIKAVNYKKSVVSDRYNELEIRFRGNYRLIFRAYDEGVAYRFVTDMKNPFVVTAEQVQFNFPGDPKAYVPYVNRKNVTKESFDKQFYNSFENTYQYINLSEWENWRLAFLPLVVEGPAGKKICITEADLLSYPGLYLTNEAKNGNLTGVFAPYPKEIKQGGHNNLQGEVQSFESFIAKCEGETSFPWRVIIVSENDYELTNNDMVYKLASPNRLQDVSWIKPGKVAWDWWNDWNLYGVDFKTGVNNETYKYYIDFASKNGIEYVILDEGWAVNKKADLMQVVPEIDLEMLTEYARSKNVGLILWAGYWALNRDIEGVCKYFSEMGIKGFKVDFMDRDDQLMVDFHRKTAEIAAKYKLMIDFHGTYKPTGLHKTYPNVINFEGVHGLEQMKWSAASVDQMTYDVTIPFIRMVAGPLDYTQGAMRNATRSNYHPVNSEPMSQGTRCHQLAQYVIFESPLNMLCDSPSNYMAEPECTRFIAEIPTTWDETVALNGEIAKYVSIARRKGDTWYVGSMTNWDARSLELDLSFLGDGNYTAEIYKDGVNAHRVAKDYKKEVIDVPANRKLNVNLAPGGGLAVKITAKR